MEFLIHNMAPIMFAALVVFLLLGYPVAFAFAANGLFFGLIGIELGLLQPDFLQALPERLRDHEQRHRCRRSRSSPSWAWCSNDRGWPRICWTP